jgi:hypothetical protein
MNGGNMRNGYEIATNIKHSAIIPNRNGGNPGGIGKCPKATAEEYAPNRHIVKRVMSARPGAIRILIGVSDIRLLH